VFVREPASFVAKQPGRRVIKNALIAGSQKIAAFDVSGKDAQPFTLDALKNGLELNANSDRNVEEGSRRRSNNLGVVEIDASTGENHTIGTCSIRSTDDRARVSGITNLFEDRDQLRPVGHNVLDRGGKLTAHRNNPLRSDGVGHRLDDLLCHKLNFNLGIFCSTREISVALKRSGSGIKLYQQVRTVLHCL